jgi:leader peptidase (prepilin peptidase) / N-methyltransferase
VSPPPSPYDRPVPTASPPAGLVPGPWGFVLLVLLAAVPVLVGTRPLLVRLPEPLEPDGKTPYRQLPTRRFVGVCTLLAGLGAGLVGLTLTSPAWPLWWVLCAPTLVLVAVDAKTTWLPLVLTHLVWAAAAGATVLATFLGGSALLGRSAVGAASAALLYLALWRLSGRGLGFGDVRLAPVLGAAAAAVGWSTLFATLLLGSVVGAAVGIVLTLRGRPGAFAYAPSMLVGAFLACGVSALSG